MIAVGVILFAVLVLLVGFRNDRRFEQRYPLAVQLRRDAEEKKKRDAEERNP